MTTQQATCGHDRPGNCSTLAKSGAQPRKAASAPPRGSRQPTFRPFRPCLACWNGARSPSEAGIRGISGKLAADDPNGRNAVWAGYEVVYLFTGDLVDRTGNHDLTIETGTPVYEAVPLGAGGGLNVAADLRLIAANVLASSTTFTLAASGTFSFRRLKQIPN